MRDELLCPHLERPSHASLGRSPGPKECLPWRKPKRGEKEQVADREREATETGGSHSASDFDLEDPEQLPFPLLGCTKIASLLPSK